MNTATLDRIQQLREILTQRDTDIHKTKRQLKGLALEDGWQIEMTLNVTEPMKVEEKEVENHREDAAQYLRGIFERVQNNPRVNIQAKITYGTTIRQQTAIRMLMVYLEDMEAERASIYKALEEAVISLKIID